jgi:hypothetical protein
MLTHASNIDSHKKLASLLHKALDTLQVRPVFALIEPNQSLKGAFNSEHTCLLQVDGGGISLWYTAYGFEKQDCIASHKAFDTQALMES